MFAFAAAAYDLIRIPNLICGNGGEHDEDT